MPGKRIALRHVIEGRFELLGRDFPGHERAVGEVGCEQRLPDAADRSCLQHRAQMRHHCVDIYTGLRRDFLERLAHKAGDLVLGDGENFPVRWIVVFDGEHSSVKSLMRWRRSKAFYSTPPAHSFISRRRSASIMRWS